MRTYRASTLPFSQFSLTEFVGELRQAGVSTIELAQVHYSDVRKPKRSPHFETRLDSILHLC